jgi:hypothetical protein
MGTLLPARILVVTRGRLHLYYRPTGAVRNARKTGTGAEYPAEQPTGADIAAIRMLTLYSFVRTLAGSFPPEGSWTDL